jgi:hypothetical protein
MDISKKWGDNGLYGWLYGFVNINKAYFKLFGCDVLKLFYKAEYGTHPISYCPKTSRSGSVSPDKVPSIRHISQRSTLIHITGTKQDGDIIMLGWMSTNSEKVANLLFFR